MSLVVRRSIRGRRSLAVSRGPMLVRRYRPMMRSAVGSRYSRSRSGYGRGVVGTTRHSVARVTSEFPVFAGRHTWNHFFFTASASYAADTTGTITLLNPITLADGINATNNQVFFMKGVQVRGFALANAATTTASATLLIVYDHSPRGALPAITDILVSASSSAFQDFQYRGRFEILMRLDYTLVGNSTAPSTGKEAQRIDRTVRFNRMTSFDTTTASAVIANVFKGALYAVTVGDVAAGTGAATITAGYRVIFTPGL